MISANWQPRVLKSVTGHTVTSEKCPKTFFVSVTLPYQLVQVFVINVSVHVSEVTAHCQDDVVRAVQRRLRLNVIYKFGHLCVCSIFV